ncbi:hypothetical protein GJU39_06405 [Pedobacter petrophilus]|uniref:Uncharacterized protein n=1 Tax=Pedobacter petrophilus TaxID=1908241 RepID=A0A7K0FW14_9SPHI|nr:hypothetical protein [Pedobacter petrophilus]MRX75715.1 hypothetical protein [Pedobacter petrophilus]
MLKKINSGLVALVLGFGLIITQSAFTASTFGTLYHYKTDNGLIQDESSWETVSTAPSFSCSEEDILPCTIEVTGSLSSYLQSNPTAEKVMASPEIRSTRD